MMGKDEIKMGTILLGTIGFVLIIGNLLISGYEFAQDKFSFYKIEQELNSVDLNQTLKKLEWVKSNGKDEIWYNRLFSIKSTAFELEQLNRVTTNDERYNGAILKIKNLTNNICKIDNTFFDQLFGKYDFIEIQNTSLKPNEETMVYIAYKNLAFEGYRTKSTRHTSLLMLDEYSSLEEEYLPYALINKLLSDEYITLEWKIDSKKLKELEKAKADSIYASVDLQKAVGLKRAIERTIARAEYSFCRTDFKDRKALLKLMSSLNNY